MSEMIVNQQTDGTDILTVTKHSNGSVSISVRMADFPPTRIDIRSMEMFEHLYATLTQIRYIPEYMIDPADWKIVKGKAK